MFVDNMNVHFVFCREFEKLIDLMNTSEYLRITTSWPHVWSQKNQLRMRCAEMIKIGLYEKKSVSLQNIFSPPTHARKIDDANWTWLLFWLDVTGQIGPTSNLRELLLMASVSARQNGNIRRSENLLKQYMQSNNNDNTINLCYEMFDSLSAASDNAFLDLAKHAATILHEQSRQTDGFELLFKAIGRTLDENRKSNSVASVKSNGMVMMLSKRLQDLQLKALSSASAALKSEIAAELLMNQETAVLLGECLTILADWMQNDFNSKTYGEILLNNEESTFVKLLEEQLEIIGATLNTDSVVGALLSLAVAIAPWFAMAQNAFANWAYRAGRKVLDAVGKESSDTAEQLFENEQIDQLLPNDCSRETKVKIYEAFQSALSMEDRNEAKSLLRTTVMNELPSFERFNQLMDVWLCASRRLFKYYDLSARAYFNFLKLKAKEKSKLQIEACCITATLRLLRLLVKYFEPLQSTLEDGFKDVDVHLWKSIIPQLFARLSHPSIAVRSLISKLLCEIAKESPHLVVYPAVVGSMSGGSWRKSEAEGLFFETGRVEEFDAMDDTLNQELEATESNNAEDALLRDCYSGIVSILDGELVAQVKLFVQEVQRLGLLREELWLSALEHLKVEMERRIGQLNREVENTNANLMLSAEEKEWVVTEKGAILCEMIGKVLRDLHELTSTGADTVHEEWFQQTISPSIASYLQLYANVSVKPTEAFQILKDLQSFVIHRATKRLNLYEVSPKLTAMRSTKIPIPGIRDENVTIDKFLPQIQSLPTKTKPKKIWFIGSDGQRHGFLFKGLEDLHLDERIMQFLEICNSLFASDENGRNLSARYYSVTPFGPRSGLIEWVEGAVPLFTLYKRWQFREASQIQQIQGAAPVIPRPSELFFGKLHAHLEARGTREREIRDRSKWPVNVLKDVLKDLKAETPSDLLQK